MKDRLLEVQKAREGLPEPNAIISVNEDPSEDDPLEHFFETVAATRNDINQVEENIKKIAEKHQQALTAYSSQQGQQAHAEIDLIMADITKTANRVRRVLKQMNKERQDLPPEQAGWAGTRIREQQQAALSKKFVDVMKDYNNVQSKYKSKYRDRVVRQYKIVNPEATEEEVDSAIDMEQGDSVFAQQILGQEHAEAQQALEEIQDRHKDIVKLEKSIRELHELFLDMAMMVNQQGEMIDRIEYQVSSSAEYVESSVGELKQAAELQSSARKKKWLFMGIFVLIGAAAILVVLNLFL